MRRRLQLSYLVLTIVILAMLEIPLAISHARSERANLTTRLERDAVSLAAIGNQALASGDTAALTHLGDVARSYSDKTGARVVVVNAAGTAVASADQTPGTTRATSADVGRSFVSRPEITRALAGNVASGVRPSKTLGYDLLYVAVPVASGGAVDGAVRVSYPSSEIDQRIAAYRLLLIAIALIMLAIAALVGWALAAWTQRPLDDLRAATAEIAAGDLDAHVPTDSGPPEVRELASEFNSMLDTIAALMDAQRAFVADASHQLRTPLAALRLRIDNLAAAHADDTSIVAAGAEVDRLASLIDGLLVLARVDGAAAEPTTVDLTAIARDRVATWEALADEQGITLASSIADDLVVRATDGALEQVLDNLIDNALDATPSGGTITVTAAGVPGVDDVASLIVSDTGRGMTADEREHAFDRFWRAPDAAAGGSGLGLAIVRELVENSGGEISLAPAQRGTGLRVRIMLRR